MMKKVKVLVAAVLFCAMGFVGYNAYNKITTSEVDEFMKANIEALTSGEPGENMVSCVYGKLGHYGNGNLRWRCQTCKYEFTYDITDSSRCRAR